MKKTMLLVYSITLLAGLILVGHPVPVCAAENDGADRLARLEQRVDQMAERQEQLLKRLDAQIGQRAPMGAPDPQNPGAGFRPQLRPQMAPAVPPLSPPDNPHAPGAAKSFHDLLGLLCLIGLICNILLATWIFTDIRKRGEGSGIFIAVALVAGIPAALIYSLTRIGDRKP